MKVEKVSVLISKKIGLPHYGSASASFGVTVQLEDQHEQHNWRDMIRYYDSQVKELVNEALETPSQKEKKGLIKVVRELPNFFRAITGRT